jgi:ribosomal protein S24E
MKTLKDFRNELLKRREVKVILPLGSNPGFQNSSNLIAQQFKAKEDSIVVKTIKSKFGRDTFLIDAYIYDSIKDKELIEPKKKVKKAATQESASSGAKK